MLNSIMVKNYQKVLAQVLVAAVLLPQEVPKVVKSSPNPLYQFKQNHLNS